MDLFYITLSVFVLSFFIFPLFFVTRPTGRGRKILLGIQIVFFVYWNAVCWGAFLLSSEGWAATLVDLLVHPRTSGPGGSISFPYFYVTPVYAAFIIIEVLVLWRAAKLRKRVPSEGELSRPT